MTRLLIALLAALVLATSAVAGRSLPFRPISRRRSSVPTCKTTLDQSSAPIAVRMKAYIRARIAAGDSASEIKAQLVDQFGPAVLAEPPKRGFDLLAWLLPLGAVAVGAVVVGALAVTWSRRRDTDADAPDDDLDPELEQRLDEELGRFED